MKNNILFKTLVDILFFLQGFAFPGFLVLMPLGASASYNVHINFDVETWNIIHWGCLILSLIIYIVFLRGLYFLRKVARLLMSKKYFTQIFIITIKKSGVNLLISGTLYFILIIGIWINKSFNNHLEITYNTNVIMPLFICTIGLFFIIQSKTLTLAKVFKEENELTV